MTQPIIKLVKLTNGDSLITQIRVNENEEYATLIAPMRVHKWMAPNEDGGAYENATFGPWESFSDDQEFHIAKTSILTLTNPREDVIRYYHRLVDKIKTTPIESFDDDAEDEMTEFDRLQKIKEVVDDLNDKLGLSGSEDEDEIIDYMYNKDNLTKH